MVLLQLVKREVKAFLKNPAFIASIILIIALYGSIGGIARRGVEEAVRIVAEMNLGVVLEEDTDFTREVVRILNQTMGGRVILCNNLREAVEKTGIGIVIPQGFTQNATEPRMPVVFESMIRVDTVSQIRVNAKLGVVTQLTSIMKYAVVQAAKNIYGVEIYLDKPVLAASSALFYGREVEPSVLQGFLTFISFLPMLVAIVIGSNVSYAAQLVSLEKVEKAFELLLSQPIKRSRIVLAKIIGASIASMLFAAVYVAGLFLMTVGMITPATGDLVTGGDTLVGITTQLGKAFGVNIVEVTLTSIGLSLVLGLYSSGALGIVLGALSSDERSAAILTTPIMMVYFGIAFVYIFLGLEPSLGIAIIAGLTILPIPALYVQSVVIGAPIYGLIAIAVAVASSLALTLLATYIFNRDTVILGVKLGLRGRSRSYFS